MPGADPKLVALQGLGRKEGAGRPGSRRGSPLDSKKLEYGYRVNSTGFPSVFGFGIRGRTKTNFLASTLHVRNPASQLVYGSCASLLVASLCGTAVV